MVNPQLRAVLCTVRFYKINFNGAVVKFAKDIDTVFDLISGLSAYVILGPKNRPN